MNWCEWGGRRGLGGRVVTGLYTPFHSPLWFATAIASIVGFMTRHLLAIRTLSRVFVLPGAPLSSAKYAPHAWSQPPPPPPPHGKWGEGPQQTQNLFALYARHVVAGVFLWGCSVVACGFPPPSLQANSEPCVHASWPPRPASPPPRQGHNPKNRWSPPPA